MMSKRHCQNPGIKFFSFWEVRGVGKAAEARIVRGIKYDTGSIERILITLFIRNKFLDPTSKASMKAEKNGNIAIGKIFVSALKESNNIGTG